MALWTPDPDPAARTRLLCLPYAGGGTVEYRQWAQRAPAGLQIVPVSLPGREARMREPAVRDMGELIAALAPAIEPLIDRPYAVFGHSMGAWVAYELVREIRRRGWPLPTRLFASGRRAPDLPDRLPPLHGLPEPAFLQGLQERYNAIPQQLLAQPAILAMFLPSLRADFELLERYEWRPEPALPLPIHAWWGSRDPVVHRYEMAAWDQHGSSLSIRQFAGGHFYVKEDRDTVLGAVLDAL